MRKISTIQKNNNLNEVFVLDEKGPGNANHEYVVVTKDKDLMVNFQKGPRNLKDSKSGVLDVDLLEIVRHRLKSFQEGDFACRENEEALRHLEECLMWLNKRVEDRNERDVLGTYKK